MATNSPTYYKLLYAHDSQAGSPVGAGIAASADTVRIGQTADCDLRVPNGTAFADEVFAIIRPCRNADGWQLIPTSGHVRTQVNGTEVRQVHYLTSGDRISFSETEMELLFETFDDAAFDGSKGTEQLAPARGSRSLRAVVAGMVVVLLGLVGFSAFIWREQKRDQRHVEVLKLARPSVVQVSVDSVYLLRRTADGEARVDSFSYVGDEGHAVVGTAFITTDSLLMTARHCIEPWLNDDRVMQPDCLLSLPRNPTRWALEAETYNQTHEGDTTYAVVCVCELYEGDNATKAVARVLSSDFNYDDSRDEILELGDYRNEYYWRSVRARHARRDMMLGDIAWTDYGQPGGIRIASEEEMSRLVKSRTRLDFMGYPEYEVAGFEAADGIVKQDYEEGRMIAHNGRLIHGYSGGPAMVVSGGRPVAVGVISVIDTRGGDRMYSVPVTAMKQKGGRR